MKIKLPVFLFVTVFVLGCASRTPAALDACLKTQAAFDIGSGSTKVKVAEVDVCQRQLRQVVWESSQAVPYEESMTISSEGKLLPLEIREKGKLAFRELLDGAIEHGATSAQGAATEAFREARNGKEVIQDLERIGNQVIPTRLTIVSQETESRMGFAAGIAISGLSEEKTIVWDIGGGSQEIAMKNADPKKPFLAFKGKVASAQFMKSFPVKPTNGRSSPNPIGNKGFAKGLQRAREIARKTVPVSIKSRLKTAETIVGLGGVMYKSVREQVGRDSFTPEDLERTLKEKINQTDEQLGGHYANTQVTNLILVLGFMKELGIRRVLAVNADLATALLVQPDLLNLQN